MGGGDGDGGDCGGRCGMVRAIMAMVQCGGRALIGDAMDGRWRAGWGDGRRCQARIGGDGGCCDDGGGRRAGERAIGGAGWRRGLIMIARAAMIMAMTMIARYMIGGGDGK